MSINDKLNRLSLDLRNVSQGSSPSSAASTPKTKQRGSKAQADAVADSWEDESLSDSDGNSAASIPLEAPGPDIKSPTTRAIDAEKELSGDVSGNIPPPPTPISPELSGSRVDWTAATTLGGGRPVYKPLSPTSSNSNSNTPRSITPVHSGSATPGQRYPTPNPPLDSTARDRDRDQDRERRRPEKTTATANRLIAGALGIRAPPKTEEQKRYERAVKEQEIKRRNKEKEEQKKAAEDDERAKAAIWDS